MHGTIMATLAAPIATSFNSLPLLAWLATAFLIGQAATQPLSGKLTDIFSRSSGLLVGNCLFALGNLICGFAEEEWTMILGRTLAGVGGGSLNSIATIIASDFIPLRQRGLWQGIGNIFWGLGNGLGGVVGGYINDTWHWKIAFLAQVPFTLISLIIIWFQLDTIRSNSPSTPMNGRASITRVDFLGSFTLVSALALLLLGLTTGGNIVPWTHPLASVSLPLAAALLCVFIFVEQKIAREPILPLHFLRDRTVLCACLTNWFFNLTTYVFIFYIPIYYRARGASTTQAGAALIPFSITFPIGSLGAGIITTKTGKYKHLLRAILLLMLLGTIASCTNRLSTPLWPAMFELAIVGLATGAMLTVTLLALISAVETSQQAVVTSLSYVFRSTGSVTGLALASAVYQGVLESDLWTKIGDQTNAADIISNIKDSLDEIDRLPNQLQWAVRSSYMVALRATYMTTAAFAVMAVVSGLLIRELKLHSTLMRDDDGGATKGESFGRYDDQMR
ncbi:hypothetical protein N7G274_010075 [Stereocaulon virgatum]|uniref:Major facilitator superfamily (MFS) profile domain-containing protein n=1 Tax=Stereocaulon virgatum TaxID=373712 RepID=A0ABR3ZUF3_9LECA